MTLKNKGLWLLFAITFTAWTPAWAHTPYLAPATFDPPSSGWVTLDASFADSFFVPDVVFDQSEFAVVDTAGRKHTPESVTALKTRVVVEHKLTDKGTYRFSTGRRYGAVFRIYEQDGERKSTRGSDPLPAGAKLLEHFQSLTLAETYVTLGAPDKGALQPYGTGLEIVPVTHPNDIYQGEPAKLTLLFDGKPLAEQTLQIFKADGSRDSKNPVLSVTTDKQGVLAFTLKDTGVYLLQARYRHAAPKDAAAPFYSHTYTLTFPVNEQ